MLIKITYKKICTDSMECSNELIKKLENKYPDLLLEAKTKDNKMHGHLSISHKKSNHTLWLFIYDKTGIHEQESQGKIKKTQSDRVKKYSSTMPTESEIKKML